MNKPTDFSRNLDQRLGMSDDDIPDLVAKKVAEFSNRPEADVWAACGAVWAHTFILTRNGWQRWPHLHLLAENALLAAFSRAVVHEHPAAGRLVGDLRNFEFDGDEQGNASLEGHCVIDVLAMLLDPIEGKDAITCATNTLTIYLERMFWLVSMRLAANEDKGVISEVDAQIGAAEDQMWLRAVSFVGSL